LFVKAPRALWQELCEVLKKKVHQADVRKCTMPRWGVKAKPIRGQGNRI